MTSLSGLRFAEERSPRHLTDLETVTIRIYDFDFNPEGEALGSWIYQEELIMGENMWEEVIRLLPEVRDLWYEGTTLYVDLFASEWHSAGGIQDFLVPQRLYYIFSSFPHVSEIHFLTEGRFGFPFTGAHLAPHIVRVSDGVGTPVHICDLSIDDSSISEMWQETWWREECE